MRCCVLRDIPKQAMYATIATVAINTILAPYFIFMFDWGIRGAAIATVSAQVIALLWQLKQFNNANELLHFRRGIFRLKRRLYLIHWLSVCLLF